jgi:hypothetical protein
MEALIAGQFLMFVPCLFTAVVLTRSAHRESAMFSNEVPNRRLQEESPMFHQLARVISLSILLVLVLVLALITGTAEAQTGSSSVRGTVVDPQNNVIPNAAVTLTNTATGQVRSQKTGPTGNFSFDLLTPGDYKAEIEAPGFKKMQVPVQALISRPSDLGEIRLQIGATDQVVTVSAEVQAVQVNTQDSALGNNFIAEQITQLPVEARNVLSLLTLQPGVTKDGYVTGARSDRTLRSMASTSTMRRPMPSHRTERRVAPYCVSIRKQLKNSA